MLHVRMWSLIRDSAPRWGAGSPFDQRAQMSERPDSSATRMLISEASAMRRSNVDAPVNMERRGLVRRVDASATVEAVFARVCESLADQGLRPLASC